MFSIIFNNTVIHKITKKKKKIDGHRVDIYGNFRYESLLSYLVSQL